MNRPRIVGVLSAVLGSTAGFLVLSRWRLAGTITGAVLMPLIFTLVSFGSHESLERMTAWARCRVRKGASHAAPRGPDPEEPAPVAQRRLHWPVAVLAVLALTLSVYSLAHSGPVGTTILREKVIQTVTVTTERAHSLSASVGPPTGGQDAPTTTTTSAGAPTPTTVYTVAGPGDGSTTTTTLP